MPEQLPHNFAYHQYLQKVVGATHPDRPFFSATEADFAKSDGIGFPYRSYFYALGLLHEGQCRIRIGLEEYVLGKQSMTLVGPGIVRHWLENNWQVKNNTFFFTQDLFAKAFKPGFLIEYPFFQPGAQHVLHLSDQEYKEAQTFIRLLITHQDQLPVVAGGLLAYLEFIDGLYKKWSGESRPAAGSSPHYPKQALVRQFNQLLYVHYLEQKEVQFYAGKLNVTSKHLSRVLLQQTGKSAKESIDEYALFEAKSLLKQTSMSVKEIVYWLGYEDPSYFNRVFKSKVGLTPLQYRER